MKRRCLSVMMSLAIALTSIPQNVFAAEMAIPPESAEGELLSEAAMVSEDAEAQMDGDTFVAEAPEGVAEIPSEGAVSGKEPELFAEVLPGSEEGMLGDEDLLIEDVDMILPETQIAEPAEAQTAETAEPETMEPETAEPAETEEAEILLEEEMQESPQLLAEESIEELKVEEPVEISENSVYLFTAPEDGFYLFKMSSYYYSIEILDNNGVVETIGNTLYYKMQMGTSYRVSVSPEEPTTLTVYKAKTIPLSEGITAGDLMGGNAYVLTFEPDTEDYYVIEGQGYNGERICILYEFYSEESSDLYSRQKLPAGITYYCFIDLLSWWNDEVMYRQVTLKKPAAPTKIQLVKDKLPAGETVYQAFSKLTAMVTYEDGTSEYVTIDDRHSSFGWSLAYDIKDSEENTCVEDDILEKGKTYTFTLTIGEKSEIFSLTAVSNEDFYETLTDTINVPEGGDTYLFTAPEDGFYLFQIPDTVEGDCSIRSLDNDDIPSIRGNGFYKLQGDEKYLVSAKTYAQIATTLTVLKAETIPVSEGGTLDDLRGGKAYVFVFVPDTDGYYAMKVQEQGGYTRSFEFISEDQQDWNRHKLLRGTTSYCFVNLSSSYYQDDEVIYTQPTVQKIYAPMEIRLNKEVLPAGITAGLALTDMTAMVTYEDGTSEDVTVYYGYTSNGWGDLRYELKDSANNTYIDSDTKLIQDRTYTLTLTIADKSESFSLQAVGMEEYYEALPTEGKTEIQEGKKVYMYTAPDDGFYRFYIPSGDSDIYLDNDYIFPYGGTRFHKLQGGKTYRVSVHANEPTTLTVRKAEEISVSVENAAADPLIGGNAYVFVFKPEEDGYYSMSANGVYGDKVMLNHFISDSDTQQKLQAGKTYYSFVDLVYENYEEGQTIYEQPMVQKLPVPIGIELNKDRLPEGEEVWRALQMLTAKVTYEDGTSEEASAYWGEFSSGWSIRFDLKDSEGDSYWSDGILKENETYTLTLTVGEFSRVFELKTVAIEEFYDTLKPGDRLPVPAGSSVYGILVEEDGYYEVRRADRGEVRVYTSLTEDYFDNIPMNNGIVFLQKGQMYWAKLYADQATEITLMELELLEVSEDGSAEVELRRGYRFEPEEDGFYQFGVADRYADVNVYDGNMYLLSADYYGDNYRYYQMEAEKAYYLKYDVSSNVTGTERVYAKKLGALSQGVRTDISEEMAFEIECDKGGLYRIKLGNARAYLGNPDGDYSYLYSNGNVTLTSGTRYLLVCNGYDDGNAWIRIEKMPEITGVELVSNQQLPTEFVASDEGIPESFFFDVCVKLTYSEGPQQTVRFGSTDTYGNEPDYKIYAKDAYDRGDYSKPLRIYDALEAGTYYVAVEGFEGKDKAAFEIKGLSVKEVAEKHTVNTETPVTFTEEQRFAGFTFTAEKSGSYLFGISSQMSLYEVSETSETGLIKKDLMSNFYECNAILDAGKTYYGILYKDVSAKPRMKISYESQLKSVKVRASKTEFIAGLESLSLLQTSEAIEAADMVGVDLTYEDGESYTVSGEQSDVRGTRCEYVLEKNGKKQSFWEPLKVGTYTLRATAKGTDISGETEIRGVAVNPAGLPLVSEDKIVSLELEEHAVTLARFIPKNTGRYYAENSAGIVQNVVFYRQTAEGLECVGDELSEGSQYILAVPDFSEGQSVRTEFRLVHWQVPELSTGGVLSVGDAIEVHVSRDKMVDYTFTPAEDGTYVLESSKLEPSALYGDCDPMVSLYQDLDKDYLKSEDDNKGNMQFRLTAELQKDVTYTFRLMSYRNISSFLLELKKQEDNQGTENQEKENPVTALSIRGIDPVYVDGLHDETGMLVTLTYQNGETETYTFYDDSSFKGSYGHSFFVEKGKRTEDDKAYYETVTVTCGNLKAESKITIWKLPYLSAKELPQGETLQTAAGKAGDRAADYYVITPEDKAEYSISVAEEDKKTSINGLRVRVADANTGEWMIDDSMLFWDCIQVSAAPNTKIYIYVGADVYETGGQYRLKVTRKKEISDIALSVENTVPAEEFWKNGGILPVTLTLSYTDGTKWETTVTMSQDVRIWSTLDSFGNDIILKKSLSGNRIQVVAACDEYGWCKEIVTIDGTGIEELKENSSLAVAQSDPGFYRLIKFVPEKKGVFRLKTEGEGAYTAALYDSTRQNLLSTRDSWRLEAGTEYLVEISGNAFKGDSLQIAQAHTMQQEWTVMKEATCTEEGLKCRYCTDEGCTYYETESIPALKHNLIDFEDPATEMKPGRTGKICSRCGLISEEKPVYFNESKAQEAQEAIAKIDTAEDKAQAIKDAVQEIKKVKTGNDAVSDADRVENNKFLDACGVIEDIKRLDQNVVENGLANATIIDVTADGIEIGENDVSGAAITALDYGNNSENASVYTAKVTVENATIDSEESANINNKAGDGKQIALDIKLLILDEQNNVVNADPEAKVQPAAPISMTVTVPEEFRGKELQLFHIHENEIEQINFQKKEDDNVRITFVITGLSDFVIKVVDCNGNHNEKLFSREDATCRHEGKETWKCEDCGKTRVETTVKAPHSLDNGVIIRAATCIETGLMEYKCKVCEATVSGIIPATRVHSWTTIVDKPATCVEAGRQHEECSVCHGQGEVTTIPATGVHNWTTVVDKKATCGAAGSQHEECSVCHEKKPATVIPATGAHNWKTVVDKKATCGAAGSQHKECSVCHKKGAATAIKATGAHSWGNYAVTKAATVLTAGVQTRTCKICGMKNTAAIAKLPAKISVNVKSIPLKVKQSTTAVKVTFGKGDRIVSWTSNNKKIATVSSSGKITGKKAGKAVITVKLASGKSAKITVNVQKADVKTTKLKLNKTSLTLAKGKSYQLTAVVTPITSKQKVTFKSTNNKIVTVNSKGKVTAKKKGTAYVVVTSGSKSVRCKIKVK